MGEFILVNESDEIIGYKDKPEIIPEDIYRVSALSVENSKGQILLAQRKFTKKNNPGLWQPAVAGTNEKGETYESNIIKEAGEEIGLFDFEMDLIHYGRYVEGENNFFGKRFKAIVEKDISEFKMQEEEVEDLKWFDKKDVLDLIEKNPEMFVPHMKEFL